MTQSSPHQSPKPTYDECDVPFDYTELDHAPTNYLGTYLDGVNDCLESLEEYQDGGFHPVHIGDCLGISDRYQVLHKLGHGGFGTVWLCRDTVHSSYVAVKIMSADASSENIPDLSLMKLDQSIPGGEHIAIPQDNFSLIGPNGTHQCLVLPVLGPCVSPRLWLHIKSNPGTVLRKMAYQASQALGFLHKNQLCHGDFRPSNILVKLADLDTLSEESLLSMIGQPQTAEVKTESGDDLPASSPRYLVLPADISRLGDEYLTDQICAIDFGEAFAFSSAPVDLGIPENYLPPEILMREEGVIGPACDLWALGCTLYEIRKQIPLFYMIYDKEELLAEMVRFFGKLPEKWWENWDARVDFFDDEGRWIRKELVEEEWTLEVLLSKSSEVVRPAKGSGKGKMTLDTPETEQRLLADLLYGLFQYDPSKRKQVDEVLDHEWFKF